MQSANSLSDMKGRERDFTHVFYDFNLKISKSLKLCLLKQGEKKRRLISFTNLSPNFNCAAVGKLILFLKVSNTRF